MPTEPNTARDDLRARFEQMALPHLDFIQGVAHRMAGNRSEAEDLVQETYLRAFRAFHQFREGSNCRAWLCKILSNLNVDRAARAANRPDRYRLGRHEYARGSARNRTGRSRPSLVYSEYVSDDMKRAMDDTPEVFRTPLLLFALGDKTYLEISSMLGCPMGTVMSRIYRGRKHVRQCLLACRGT